ncbi:MAG: hypothetical protein Hyperionvirus4_137 [Hyperionvirus sp.]|uniref:Uncharacterized protein n=1 Tax=Hyperionvirus sp. TaxID=2487770 RepID=A0A3G5A7Z9_9VIRU|nr:MAG: hypothetical protein Hyperionvirus4_137 [Hyperionvirus sp.]
MSNDYTGNDGSLVDIIKEMAAYEIVPLLFQDDLITFQGEVNEIDFADEPFIKIYASYRPPPDDPYAPDDPDALYLVKGSFDYFNILRDFRIFIIIELLGPFALKLHPVINILMGRYELRLEQSAFPKRYEKIINTEGVSGIKIGLHFFYNGIIKLVVEGLPIFNDPEFD